MSGFASQIPSMALLGSGFTSEVGLRVLLSPLGSNIVLRTACCSIGIGLPVYSTFKAIESRDENEQRKWLIYWAAYGSFSLVEVFTDKIISWFPLYYHVKFAFLVWLQLPTVEGSKQIYNNQIRPFLLRHQARVDRLVDGVYDEMVSHCFLQTLFLIYFTKCFTTKQLQVKVVRSHQGEIRFIRAMIAKLLGSVNEVVPPGQRLGEIADESPSAERNSDSESDSNHDD
ncbi:hypothetical protein CARUB_v10005665mg [Capsella rubella]|uniref:HVA22-like protein n=1 Tax=Capsella rubella TaxID=81985 RepID=R0F6C4_9BRAS|nr:hypothetical protein CARUB_v10005665mg [Capsella rubella]